VSHVKAADQMKFLLKIPMETGVTEAYLLFGVSSDYTSTLFETNSDRQSVDVPK